ncbi:hypothetical protein EPN18_07410 [bacterium]|nr:MAG: hypothetical protein EPN18_07410 [bacterium]
MPEKIDAKYLKGLRFRGSEGKNVNEDGRTVIKYAPVERAMRVEDVLNWRDAGSAIVLVTTDGQKVTVSKTKEAKDEK